MKEIRMDFDSYEKEMKEAKKEAEDTGSFWVLYKMYQWLTGEITLKKCLIFNESTNLKLTEISILLKREDELKNNEIESVKKEEEEDVSTITKYA